MRSKPMRAPTAELAGSRPGIGASVQPERPAVELRTSAPTTPPMRAPPMEEPIGSDPVEPPTETTVELDPLKHLRRRVLS